MVDVTIANRNAITASLITSPTSVPRLLDMVRSSVVAMIAFYAVAHRLTEDGNARVLLIEAGGWDRDPWLSIPLAWAVSSNGGCTTGCISLNPRRRLTGAGGYDAATACT